MATLTAYNPEHGIHPWSWMKTRLSDHSYRGLTVTHQESGRAQARSHIKVLFTLYNLL